MALPEGFDFRITFGWSEGGRRRVPLRFALLTQVVGSDSGAITLDVLALQVVQQTAALTDHLQQTTAGVVVLLVVGQVLVQLVDAGSQNGDLNLGDGASVKEPSCNRGDIRDAGSIPGLGRSPGERNGYPLQYSCLENPHGQRSLAGYNPWGRKE